MQKIGYLCLMLICQAHTAYADESCLPFIGERLSFSVGWEFVNAGSATMVVNAPKTGEYRIQVAARTNRFLDLFKKVRDTITSEGRCLNGKTQSTLFQLKQRERSYTADKISVFDWQHEQVLYTEKNKTDMYPVPKGHLNVMDAFIQCWLGICECGFCNNGGQRTENR